MPATLKTYDDVYREWAASGKPGSLEEFAFQQDLYSGEPSRQAAYNDNWLKALNNRINQALSPVSALTGVAGEVAGGVADDVFGTTRGAEIGRSVGTALPRQAAELGTWLVPGGAAVKTAGLVSSFASGYSDTDSFLAGLIQASTLPLAGPTAAVGTRLGSAALLGPTRKAIAGAGGNLLAEGAVPAISGVGARVAEEAGRQTAFLGLGELQRQATGLVTGQGFTNPLSEENIYANVFGNLAFAPLSVRDLVKGFDANGVSFDSYSHLRQAQLLGDYEGGLSAKRAEAARAYDDAVKDEALRMQQLVEADEAQQTPGTIKYIDLYPEISRRLGVTGENVPSYPLEPEVPYTGLEDVGYHTAIDPETNLVPIVRKQAMESQVDSDYSKEYELSRLEGEGGTMVPPPEYRDYGELDAWLTQAENARLKFQQEAGFTKTGDQTDAIPVQEATAATGKETVQGQAQGQETAGGQEGVGQRTAVGQGVLEAAVELPTPKTLGETVGVHNKIASALQGVLTPEARKVYESQGLLPAITEDWIKTTFKSDLETSITGSSDEALFRVQEKVKARYNELLDQAKATVARRAQEQTLRKGIEPEIATFMEQLSAAPREVQDAFAGVDVNKNVVKNISAALQQGAFERVKILAMQAAKSQAANKSKQSGKHKTSQVIEGKDAADQADIREDEALSPEASGYANQMIDVIGKVDDAKMTEIAGKIMRRNVAAKGADLRAVLLGVLSRDPNVRKPLIEKYAKSTGDWNDVVKNFFGASTGTEQSTLGKIFQEVARAGGVEFESTGLARLSETIQRQYNIEAPKDFVPAASIKQLLYKHLNQREGYSPDVAQVLADVGDRIHKQFPFADDVKFAELPESAQLNALFTTVEATKKLVGIESPMVAMVDKAYQHLPRGAVRGFMKLVTLGHELNHNLEFRLAESKDLSDPLLQAFAPMRAYSDALQPHQRKAALRNLLEMAVPEKFLKGGMEQGIHPGLDKYLDNVSQTGAEFRATYAGILAVGLGSKPFMPSRISDVFHFLPIEEVLFARGIYRSLASVGSAIEAIGNDPTIRTSLGKAQLFEKGVGKQWKDYHENALKLVSKSRVVDIAAADANNLLAGLGGNWAEAIRARSYFAETAEEKPGPISKALDLGKAFLAGPLIDKPVASNIFWRTFAPFGLRMFAAERKGLTVAGDAKRLLFDIQGSITRTIDEGLGPLLARDVRGRKDFDMGTAVMELSSTKDMPAKLQMIDSVNKIVRRMQELEKPVRDPSMQETVNEATKGLSEKSKTIVLGTVDKMTQVYDRYGDIIIRAKTDEYAYRVARIGQVAAQTNKLDVPWKDLVKMAQASMQAATTGNLTGIDMTNPVAASMVKTAAELNPVLQQVSAELNSKKGWFASETRPGSWVVVTRDKNGVIHTDGADSKAHAELVVAEMTKAKGHTLVESYNKFLKFGDFYGNLPAAASEKLLNLEVAAWKRSLGAIEQQHGKAIADQLAAAFDPGREIEKAIVAASAERILQKRELKAGRERLNYLRVMGDYALGTAGALQRRNARLQMDLILNDAQLAKQDTLRNDIKAQFDMFTTPENPVYGKIKTMASSYFMGANFANMLVEGGQAFSTTIPTLVESSGSLSKAYKMAGLAGREVVNLFGKGKLESLVKSGVATPERERATLYQRALDSGQLGAGHLDDQHIGLDRHEILARRFGHGIYDEPTTAQLAANKLYRSSQMLLWGFSRLSNFNERLAFLAGLHDGQAKGLTGDGLYQHAMDIKTSSTFGGGKAARPGVVALLGNRTSQPILSMMTLLQTYSLGFTTDLFRRGWDAIGANRELTPLQRRASQKAFGSQFGTLVALGGAVGLPFAGAILRVLEDVFGLEAEKAVREGLSSLGGDDKALGNAISDIAMTGMANHLLGVDIGARVGISQLVGTSSYEGFNFADLAGPIGGIMSNVISATKAASEGNLPRAAKALVPQTFKNIVDVATNYKKYGDYRYMDAGNNLVMEMNGSQAALYALGLKPKEIRDWRTAQQLLSLSDQLATQEQNASLDQQAMNLRSGKFADVLQYINERRLDDDLFDPREAVRSIVKRASSLEFQKDLLQTGLVSNAPERRKIADLVGQAPRPVESARLQYEALMMQQLGHPFGIQPPTQKDYLRALLIDQMIKVNGLSRQEAVRVLKTQYGL